MSKSDLQDAFLQEFAACFRATSSRILNRLDECDESNHDTAAQIVRDELSGLYHGVLVMFDGGTALADQGLTQIVDESGNAFDRYLHELCFEFWPEDT